MIFANRLMLYIPFGVVLQWLAGIPTEPGVVGFAAGLTCAALVTLILAPED